MHTIYVKQNNMDFKDYMKIYREHNMCLGRLHYDLYVQADFIVTYLKTYGYQNVIGLAKLVTMDLFVPSWPVLSKVRKSHYKRQNILPEPYKSPCHLYQQKTKGKFS